MEGDVRGELGRSTIGAPIGALAPGDVIGDKYRLEAVIGRGGMSVVYRATHLELEQQVALKVLSAEALVLPEYVVRLRREARAVSRIRSEHVVRIHDIGELPARGDVPGVPYLVMEYLSGLDLAAVLSRRGPLPVDLAIECVLQSCEALAEAHALGIVHRDLKPANLFLTEGVDGSPCVKVLDFGISRMSRRHGLTSLTDPGIVLGTPSYMAPEQMEAADTVDARSDIWALGTILHELVVGRPPYTGDSLPQIFMKIMRARPPRASHMREGVPSGIDAIVARCLALEAADRFQTVADLGWALSTVGTPHARDSAERISRVFDRRSSEAASATAGEWKPVVVPSMAPPFPRARGATRQVAAVLAGAAILGVASVFGVLAAYSTGDAGARAVTPSTSTSTVPVLAAGREDLLTHEALTIAPMTRPGAEVVSLAAPQKAAVLTRPGPAPAQAQARGATGGTMVAVSLPGRLLGAGDAKARTPKPTTNDVAHGVVEPEPADAGAPVPAPEMPRSAPTEGLPSNDVD